MPISKPDPFVREAGRRIREARRAQGLTQEEVALAAGVATRALHAIEHGRVRPLLSTMQRILSVLGLTLEIVPRSTRRMSEPDAAEDGGQPERGE
jgi:HTH-type transcriptional repressor of puuD